MTEEFVTYDVDTSTGEVNVPEPSNTELTAATMTGDLVSALLDELKAAPDVWQKMSEYKQEMVIDRLTRRVKDNVRQAVNLIASQGREVITADLEQITAKDGIKAVCTLGKHDPNRHALLDSVGKSVLIIVADASEFMGGDVPEADPQQPPLIEGEDSPPVSTIE